MLSGISHDLRTPLTRMKLQISLMKNENGKKELENDINEMTAMLDSYVSFVRGEAPEPIEQINLGEFIEEVCKSVKVKDQKLSININSKINTSGRPLQLKRSIKNIIENALRYANKIQVDVYNDDDNFYILISDNGPGIPEKKY